jgi:hypothetical protein
MNMFPQDLFCCFSTMHMPAFSHGISCAHSAEEAIHLNLSYPDVDAALAFPIPSRRKSIPLCQFLQTCLVKVKTFQMTGKGFGGFVKTFVLMGECEGYSGIEKVGPLLIRTTPRAETTEPSHEPTLQEAKGGLSLAAARCTLLSACFQQICSNLRPMPAYRASKLIKICSLHILPIQ